MNNFFRNYRYIFLIFWIGFSSLIYEIYSVKILFMFILESTSAAAISISAFLGGLAFSSLYFSRKTFKKLHPHTLILLMQLLVAFYAFFVLRQVQLIPESIDFIATHFPAGIVAYFKFSLFWIFLFIPAFFIGGAFPLVNDLYLAQHHEKKDTSIIYFWDTLGALLGALLTGFIFIPDYGLPGTIAIAIAINFILAVFLTSKKIYQIILVLYALLLPSYILHQAQIPEPRVDTPSLPAQVREPNRLDQKIGKIIFRKNSPFGQISIGDNALGIAGNRGLFVNYRDMCHSKVNRSEKMIGKITADNVKPDAQVLNIGLGCGFTASQIAQHPQVASVDIAEINPVIYEASKTYFDQENGGVLRSPKVKVHIQDGAEYIRQSKKSFDAVIIDIEEVSIVYSSPLYTQEYFKIIQKKLKPAGVFALWSFYVSPSFSRVIFNTLKSVFPHVYFRIWESNITFYASSRKLDLPRQEVLDQGLYQTVLEDKTTEINTIENRALEKKFNIQNVFGLPGSYYEKYLRKN